MPRNKWQYDGRVNNYRNTTTGRFISFDKVKNVAMQMSDASADTVETLAWALVNDELRLDHWQTLMRDAIKNEHAAQYMAGRGGRSQMTPRDYGIIGNILTTQYKFLADFASDIASGGMTPLQIVNRARMYIENAHQSLWRGRTEALGMPRLPTYPAQCDTTCLTRCRCVLAITTLRGPSGITGWNVTWVLDPLAREVHCADCPEIAKIWSPLYVPAGMGAIEADAWRKTEREKILSVMAG